MRPQVKPRLGPLAGARGGAPGVRIAEDPIFRSGATYQVATSPEEPDDLLARLVSALNVDELRYVQQLVKAAL